MAYKRELISTNQPIQLLDNSKYSETVDSNGRINVSQPLGRGDKEVTWLVQSNIPVVKNHKYYAASNYFSVNMEGNFTAYIAFDNGEFSTPSIVDGISTCLATGLVSFYLKYSRSSGPGGVTVKATAGPQLFDLTATFGAGNEPSTVAEFKTKYPNELYDYRTSNCLSSYKKLLKVSDVCQLLDKSIYSATRTINGVTFTNNGDGTITANGTATKETNLLLNNNEVPIIKNHIYCVLGSPFGGSPRTYCTSTSWGSEDGNGIIQKNTRDIISGNYYIHIEPNYTANNLVFIPQVFDLTEMYGAGNEPATVEEFKAKFPNELYDYSPRCWVTSYKTGLIAKTKNLFNINALTPYTPETLPTNTAGKYNGNIIARAGAGNSVSNPHISLKEFCPDLVVGETYSLSFETNATGDQANIIYLSDANFSWTRGTSKVITENDLTGEVFFYANYPDLTIATISNFQIEKGTTATNYVPYGYL